MTEEIKTIPSRSRCTHCREYYAVDFWVTEEVWTKTMRGGTRCDTICLKCFASMADERLVRWEVGLELTPISLITNLERTGNPMVKQSTPGYRPPDFYPGKEAETCPECDDLGHVGDRPCPACADPK